MKASTIHLCSCFQVRQGRKKNVAMSEGVDISIKRAFDMTEKNFMCVSLAMRRIDVKCKVELT